MNWLGFIDPILKGLDIPKKQDIDAIEDRLQAALHANHSTVLAELKDHDARVRESNQENRRWMENQFNTHLEILMNLRNK